MSENLIRISIVVATKDHYDTLYDCIDSLLLNYDRDEVEIVVRDNSARPRIEDFITRFGARPNIQYSHDPRPVSQSENYEHGVTRARGEFVTMIGDDDGVAGGLLTIVRWMELHDLDAFFPGFAHYLWPGVSARMGATNPDGRLHIRSWSEPRLVDPVGQRQAVLASGSTSLEELPRLYYGLVRRRCLDWVRAEAGACFPGPSPDMANAYALSYAVRSMAVAYFPVFIAGNSRQSNAGLGLRGKHVGEIHDQPFLPQDTADRWNPFIPYFWSGQTIWCQSAYTAACALGQMQEFKEKNEYRVLYAQILVFHPRSIKRLFSAFSGYCGNSGFHLVTEAVAVLVRAAAFLSLRAAGFLKRRLTPIAIENVGGSLTYTGVYTIVEATKRVDALVAGIDLNVWLDHGQNHSSIQ